VRTTLTIDDDVAAQLEQLRASGRSLKQLVNDALRAGLATIDGPAPQRSVHATGRPRAAATARPRRHQ
jgi:Arc/MetJ family transcription regulator